MDARSVIAPLRLGREPSAEALAWFAQGLADGTISDAQAGAFAMGVCISGLGDEARAALTMAMRDSGDVLDWDLDAPVLDKHSTGGVGDCVSLVLAPALAACGVYVPMISGRGLGHTGGTLDKLEAIPGYNISPDADRFRQIVADVGCAIVSASSNMAPADKRLYAIRDVTATVESLDLICASILSKKLAAGLEGLVLDVKCGAGAFMKTQADAHELAKALVDTANAAGCKTTALVTSMAQPLAPNLGNALEIDSALQVLTGQAKGALYEITLDLGDALLGAAGIIEGREALAHALSSGVAAERFAHMTRELGGPVDLLENWQGLLPKAPIVRDVPAPEAGVVCAMDGEALGMAVVHLGGGRQLATDVVDPSVGLANVVRLGTKLSSGDPVCQVHAADEGTAQAAIKAVQAAISVGAAPCAEPLVLETIT